MRDKNAEIIFYEKDRAIKIDRFFEVADYLTANNLWKEVETLMKESPIIGKRINMDMHLGNAVKIVMMRHAHTEGTLDTDKLVKATVRCATPHR